MNLSKQSLTNGNASASTTSKRELAAAIIMGGLVARPTALVRDLTPELAKLAVAQADLLLHELSLPRAAVDEPVVVVGEPKI